MAPRADPVTSCWTDLEVLAPQVTGICVMCISTYLQISRTQLVWTQGTFGPILSRIGPTHPHVFMSFMTANTLLLFANGAPSAPLVAILGVLPSTGCCPWSCLHLPKQVRQGEFGMDWGGVKQSGGGVDLVAMVCIRSYPPFLQPPCPLSLLGIVQAKSLVQV